MKNFGVSIVLQYAQKTLNQILYSNLKVSNLTRDCSSHVGPLKSTLSVPSLIRIAFLSVNAIIGFNVPECIIHKSSFTAVVAVTSGAVDKVLFAE